tara:strand:- start:459 stop:824 length:366 start_codon:yes stop_codon:yes gene_type:complete
MGKVAPHENCEVRLVLGGNKPLAAIEKSKDPYGYALAIAMAGTGALAKYIVEPGEVLITKPNNWAYIVQYISLLNYGVKRLGIKEYHRRMGKIFGYTAEDIEAFIEAEIVCSCTKCSGKLT